MDDSRIRELGEELNTTHVCSQNDTGYSIMGAIKKQITARELKPLCEAKKKVISYFDKYFVRK